MDLTVIGNPDFTLSRDLSFPYHVISRTRVLTVYAFYSVICNICRYNIANRIGLSVYFIMMRNSPGFPYLHIINVIDSLCLSCCTMQRKVNTRSLSDFIQWWFVNPGSNNPEILLIRTKSVGTDLHVQTNGWFSNPENSIIRNYHPGTNVSG